AVFSALPLLAACPKKETPVVDAAPPPPPPEEASTTVLVPMEDDAGVDAAPEAGPEKTGAGVPANGPRPKPCRAGLRSPAKGPGAWPEAGMLLGAAGQCDVMAAQAGPSGNAPELGALRGILSGKTIPPVCAGF